MFLSSLKLKNFRSFIDKKLQFSARTTLIVGPNASGKTNILEAVYLLSRGKSFRAGQTEEMINNNQEIANLYGQLDDSDQLTVVLTKGKLAEKKVSKKIYQFNGVSKKWTDFAGNLRCVLFRPEDFNIILGPPSARRDYLDYVLEQIDWRYRSASLTYKKGLRRRNKLLEKIRKGQASRSQLTFWNQLLIKNGGVLTLKREELIDSFNQFFNQENQLLTNKKIARIGKIKIFYNKNPISKERLEKSASSELAAGMTLVGPQRDEIVFKAQRQPDSQEQDLSLYGSRGEQRMVILTLKLAELDFIYQQINDQPVLLLDDIFSELDQDNRNQILKIIPRQQTIITTTEVSLINKSLRDKIKIINFPRRE